MRLIRLGNAEVADVLAADVQDSDGTLLVAKGVALTPHLVELLRKRGIRRIPVLDGAAVPVKLSDAQREAIQRAVDEHFQYVARDPFMMRLKEIVLRVYMREDDSPGDETEPPA